MKIKTTLLTMIGMAFATISTHAAVINIANYTLVPDGTEYGTSNLNSPATQEAQITEVSTLNGGNVLPGGGISSIYMVSTFVWGEDSAADIYLNFAASIGQDRLGVVIYNTGLVSSYGDNTNTSNDFNFSPVGGSMAGQTVTILMEFLYDVDRSASNNDDTLMNVWINPTPSSTASGGIAGGDFQSVWNSSNFIRLEQRIDNNSTPAPPSAEGSSILNTTVFTGSDATWGNALTAATIPEPSSALLVGVGLLSMLVYRRRI